LPRTVVPVFYKEHIQECGAILEIDIANAGD